MTLDLNSANISTTWRLYKWGYGIPLRVPVKGSIGFLGFRGSFKWGYK